MSASDWTVDNDSEVTQALSTSPKIATTVNGLDVSSLRWQFSITGNARILQCLTLGADLTSGFAAAVVKIQAATHGSSGVLHVGVCGMVQDMTPGSMRGANAYHCYFRRTATTDAIRVGKGSIAAPTVLKDVALSAGTLAVGTTHTIGLKWQRDAGTGQVVLTPYRGAALDFSDLVVVSAGIHTDNSSPYSTALTAGLCGYADGGGSSHDILLDRTRIDRA